MLRYRHFAIATALLLAPLAAQAQNSQDVPLSESAEKHLSPDEPTMMWARDPSLFEREGGDRLEVQATKEVRRGRVEEVGLDVRRGDDGITVCG